MWINWFLRVPEINWVLVNSLAFGISNSKQFRICTNVMSYTTSNPIFPITTSHSHSQNMFVPAPQCVAPVTKQTCDEMLHVPPPGHTNTPRWLVLTGGKVTHQKVTRTHASLRWPILNATTVGMVNHQEVTWTPAPPRRAFIRQPLSLNRPFYLKPHADHDRVDDKGQDEYTSSNCINCTCQPCQIYIKHWNFK